MNYRRPGVRVAVRTGQGFGGFRVDYRRGSFASVVVVGSSDGLAVGTGPGR